MVEPEQAVAPADEALVLLPSLGWGDVPLVVNAAFLNDLNIERECHRRLPRAAAALVAAVDAHPGDAIPRDALAPALAHLRRYVFRHPDPPSPTP